MGTFHRDRGSLHGITVVVDTHGAEIYAGRCHEMGPDGIELRDADLHHAGSDGQSKLDFLKEVGRYGPWARYPRLFVPAKDVRFVARLADLGHLEGEADDGSSERSDDAIGLAEPAERIPSPVKADGG